MGNKIKDFNAALKFEVSFDIARLLSLNYSHALNPPIRPSAFDNRKIYSYTEK